MGRISYIAGYFQQIRCQFSTHPKKWLAIVEFPRFHAHNGTAPEGFSLRFGATPRPAVDFAQHFRVHADVAQLVARNLAKVQVAGSNPVVRSESRRSFSKGCDRRFFYGGVAERRGSGLQILPHGFKSRLHLQLQNGAPPREAENGTR